MTTYSKILAVPLLAGCLLPAAFAQGGAPSQPIDPTAQSPVAAPPQTTPPTFPSTDEKQSPDAQVGKKDAKSTTSSMPDGVRTFNGSIAKQHGVYMLKAGNDAFKLDDQAKAKEFKGKNVTVTGSLDKSTNTIHVENIEDAASM